MGTFGNTTNGTNNAGCAPDDIFGNAYTCPETCIAESISVRLLPIVDPTTVTMKCAIYTKIGLNLVGQTEEKTIVVTGAAQWFTWNFIVKPSLTGGVKYYLLWWTDGSTFAGGVYFRFNVGGGDELYKSSAYGAWPNPLPAPTYLLDDDCIYCTYSLAKPKGTIALHCKLAGII